jgi:hypothetical protein
MGQIRRVVGWILGLAILATFPWLIPPAFAYWAWRRGTLKRALGRLSDWAKERNVGAWVAGLDASVSTGMSLNEAIIRYEAPCDDSPYIIVQHAGEKRIMIASSLEEEPGTRGNFGAVVASIMSLLGGLSWSITFSFYLSGGEVRGLVALDRLAPESGRDLKAVSMEALGQIAAVEQAVKGAAPSLSVRSLKGKDLARLALWGHSA